MAQLVWNQAGDRFYETGVDHGVLYVGDQPGVAWNGLVSVTESPSGAEVTSQYAGNRKYLNLVSEEEFGGTIEAYTYPEEFEVCDGTANIYGISISQQGRMPFGFSYRTIVGNDLSGVDRAYKIHIVYNALATPSEVAYSSTTDQPEALTFSWDFTTTVESSVLMSNPMANGIDYLKPFSHLSLDSRRIKPYSLRLIEEYMYGSDRNDTPKLPTLEKLVELLELDIDALVIKPDHESGMPPILASSNGRGDLIGSFSDGIYYAPPESRLKPSPINGLYILE